MCIRDSHQGGPARRQCHRLGPAVVPAGNTTGARRRRSHLAAAAAVQPGRGGAGPPLSVRVALAPRPGCRPLTWEDALFTTRPELAGTYGMVASTHWLASASGMAVLEAAGMVLHVVEPHLNGLGGDMPLIGRTHDGTPFVLCGQGPAPAAATPEVFGSLGLETIPGTGRLAAGPARRARTGCRRASGRSA